MESQDLLRVAHRLNDGFQLLPKKRCEVLRNVAAPTQLHLDVSFFEVLLGAEFGLARSLQTRDNLGLAVKVGELHLAG